LAGVRLQAEYERRAFELGGRAYLCPIQGAQDFLLDRPSAALPACSHERGAVLARIAELVPQFLRDTLCRGLPILDRRWRGKFLQDATLAGPESRGSSPVRIVRDEQTRQSPGIDGLYPVGEGAGYAGGIVSAAVDGLRSAVAVIQLYSPLVRR
ncbi:MAG: FAD-dependent oxidoreductase, partial [Gemmataceae bacterium]|nr:FAD-dependent oxidoreductase [Gemmataceae bacterium]